MPSTDEIKNSLGKILIERDEHFPIRDATNTQQLRTTVTQYADRLQDIHGGDWSADSELAARARGFAGNPIFLCGPMKGGTTMGIVTLTLFTWFED